jgi:hypothetical protein
MSSRVIIVIVALAGVGLCGLIATLIYQEIVNRVNEKLAPQENQYFPKTWREYPRLFADGKQLWLYRAFAFAMFGCWLCLIWAIGLMFAVTSG